MTLATAPKYRKKKVCVKKCPCCVLGFPADTPLVLYEEIKPDFVEKINNYNDPLEKVLFISFA